mgnify:CR=1 FL=1
MRESDNIQDSKRPWGRMHVFELMIFLMAFFASLPSAADILTTTSRQSWPTAPDAGGLYQAVGEISLVNTGTSPVRLKKAAE